MQINNVTIVNTFAEAFDMWAARLIITANTRKWAEIAASTAAGLAVSVIGCNCEAGLECPIPSHDTPDGRPGWAVLLFARSKEELETELFKRISQGVLPSPTSACYNGLNSPEKFLVGRKVRYFGDGYQSSKRINGARYWRIPVADGEFIVEEAFGVTQGIGGGNLIIFARNQRAAIQAAQAAIKAISQINGVITPFPGGICRSPSKIGSRYKGLIASTNDAYCPTIRGQTATMLPLETNAVYEIVIDGLDRTAIEAAMRAGILAASRPGVIQITAGNYGGRLGSHQFYLHQILKES